MTPWLKYTISLFQNPYSILGSLLIIVFPLFSIYQSDKAHRFFKTVSHQRKITYLLFIVPGYIFVRFLLLIITLTMIKLISPLLTPETSMAIWMAIFVDLVFWWSVKKLRWFSEELLAWKMILLYFFEFNVITIVFPPLTLLANLVILKLTN